MDENVKDAKLMPENRHKRRENKEEIRREEVENDGAYKYVGGAVIADAAMGAPA
ncbi:MAG: hypothetical protein ACOCW2_00480 [Chitinivibrionales bacterium]